MNLKPYALALFAALIPAVNGGPVAYAVCQTGCNALAVSCYAAAGFTFGVTIVGAPAAILGCNTSLGMCMAACATAALLAPTP